MASNNNKDKCNVQHMGKKAFGVDGKNMPKQEDTETM